MIQRLATIGMLVSTVSPEARPFVGLEHVVSSQERLVADWDPSPVVTPSSRVASVEPGDVLFGKLRPYLRKSLLVTRPLHASTELLAIRPAADVDSRWLSFLASAQPFVDWSVATSEGSKMPRTSWEKLRDFCVEVPPQAEQRRIADFLDAETSRIDALIAAKQQMITKLTEGQLAIQGSLCAGGAVLDFRTVAPRYVKVRAGWRSTWLRHLRCDVQTGPFGSQLHADEYVQDGWPVINPANLRTGRITRIAGMSVSGEKRAELGRHVLEPGDIVFGRRGEMGRAGLVENENAGWLCGTGSLRLRLRDDRLLPEFLKLQLESTAARSYFLLQSVGSTMDNLNEDIVLGVPLVMPPIAQQAEIVGRIRRSRASAVAATSALTRQIELLRERRQALITAAVTGEFEVP